MSKANKLKITITMRPETAKRVEKLERAHGKSFSQVCEDLICQALPEAELRTDARQDPVVEAIVAEMLRPENLERAARIVGQASDEPDLFKQRAAELAKRVGRLKGVR